MCVCFFFRLGVHFMEIYLFSKTAIVKRNEISNTQIRELTVEMKANINVKIILWKSQ